MIISKTIFLDYVFCPKNTWLKLHKPELLEKFELSAFEQNLMEQGNEVEAEAHKLSIFAGGVEVLERGEEAVEKTRELMEERTPCIFQATFIEDGFIARNDALVWNEKESCWDLYEIKGTNSLKEGGTDHNHIDDLTFQESVLSRADVPMGKYFLVHLNKDYVRFGALNTEELFLIEDQTEAVTAGLALVEEQMKTAKEYLNNKKEPSGGCECIYNGRSRHCTTFAYSNPEVPSYSVHDISRIGTSKKKLATLVDGKIFNMLDIPEGMELSDVQVNQITVHRRQKPMIDMVGISEEIKDLVFPLYFFDYETYAPAIPAFDGFRPYQRIPFQFSLHILEKPGDKMSHIEYLHEKRSDPSDAVAKLLEKNIGPKGTVIAWNKSFEAGVNRELGERLPEHKATMERINNMLYDLMDVFKKQHFVHPKFKGSTSIKKVLPALVDLSYDSLVIKEGGQASNSWWEMTDKKTPLETSEHISKHLKIYCGQDTYAMYAIWDKLYRML
ncbi:MAG: hypothetical protein A2747_02080 [Candidatus Yonathbacteria bacterium RIFCSPHIGHO2_01_FULL_44_41]|uniref:DUF2779 domain-containing protein n=1 Tax=Candidatus Yonathbacteria bacterium RIFCSPHIGHO2_02_FULL_44_14 TaxID=1802724 RepID=A0A1G2SA98_9BACT|nr:MAG: hypothetical protein A2747_02080 [Candidatus Yonathbacteria bacterium RIFCSPHIGHO2_01_FULL_44_41]OHA81649.1 MAG: hypothetical protein A3D51_02655 [Candidatus Yonathbacteria bacterium RIFCSPHIGHO2_02_FULL_44_14]OHA81830.1 MAG: hypothetical protein A3B06_02590 [Candidatus Yonathbacteria bacterium RIFCSPLOWO2_01_FULL_43_20]